MIQLEELHLLRSFRKRWLNWTTKRLLRYLHPLSLSFFLLPGSLCHDCFPNPLFLRLDRLDSIQEPIQAFLSHHQALKDFSWLRRSVKQASRSLWMMFNSFQNWHGCDQTLKGSNGHLQNPCGIGGDHPGPRRMRRCQNQTLSLTFHWSGSFSFPGLDVCQADSSLGKQYMKSPKAMTSLWCLVQIWYRLIQFSVGGRSLCLPYHDYTVSLSAYFSLSLFLWAGLLRWLQIHNIQKHCTKYFWEQSSE